MLRLSLTIALFIECRTRDQEVACSNPIRRGVAVLEQDTLASLFGTG